MTNVKSDNLYLLLLKQQLSATTDSLSSYFPVLLTVLCWRFIFGWVCFPNPFTSCPHRRAYQCNGRMWGRNTSRPWQTLHLNHAVQEASLPSPVCKGSPDRFVSQGSPQPLKCQLQHNYNNSRPRWDLNHGNNHAKKRFRIFFAALCGYIVISWLFAVELQIYH